MQVCLLQHISYDRTRVFRNACVKALEKSSSNKTKKTKNKRNKKKRLLNWINTACKVFILESAEHLTSDVSLLDGVLLLWQTSAHWWIQHPVQHNRVYVQQIILYVKEQLTLNHNSVSSTETGVVRKLPLSIWFRNSTFAFYVTYFVAWSSSN
jgi:hypothetical protein